MSLHVSDDSKGALLVSIINKYTRYYTETLKGERFINNELSGAARINTVIEDFKNELMIMEAFEDMNDLDLHISMTNYKGLHAGLVISDKAFTKLIKKAINRLLGPCLECLNKITSELKTLSYKIRVEEMKVLANARTAILSEMEKVITSCY